MKLDGNNSTQLAAVLEYLQLPNHPMHDEAKRMADEYVNNYREEQTRRLATMMQNQLDGMDDEALSDFRAQTN